MQPRIDDFNWIFQERLRGIFREGLLAMFEADLTALCGDSYRPRVSPFRQVGSERLTIRTSQGTERVAKRLVGETLPGGTEREVRLKSYEEVGSRNGTIGRVCCWNPKTDQLSGWISAALLRAPEGFRWIHWHKEIGALAAALGRSGSATSSAAPQRGSAFGTCSPAAIQLSNGHQPYR